MGAADHPRLDGGGRGVRAWAALAPLLLSTSCNAAIPVQTVEIVRSYPHDPGAFTQGLLFLDGKIYESTGLEGRSSIREVRLEDGRVLRQVAVPRPYFGEGLAAWGPRLISLTWQHGLGFIYDRATLRKIGEWRYPGEGWGLASTGRELAMSDGTPVLRFLDPATLKERRRLTVTADGQPVHYLNELEWVKGEIYANVWQTDRIARIDPASGKVKGWLDLSALVSKVPRRSHEDVLNGIAYDAKTGRLFVTGKNWPMLYEVRVK
jgi:glutaminyl-peptide cyclotransferase